MMGGMTTPWLSKTTALFRRMLDEESGATAMEYALMATALALSIIAGVVVIGGAAVDLLTIPTEVFSAATG